MHIYVCLLYTSSSLAFSSTTDYEYEYRICRLPFQTLLLRRIDIFLPQTGFYFFLVLIIGIFYNFRELRIRHVVYDATAPCFKVWHHLVFESLLKLPTVYFVIFILSFLFEQRKPYIWLVNMACPSCCASNNKSRAPLLRLLQKGGHLLCFLLFLSQHTLFSTRYSYSTTFNHVSSK